MPFCNTLVFVKEPPPFDEFDGHHKDIHTSEQLHLLQDNGLLPVDQKIIFKKFIID